MNCVLSALKPLTNEQRAFANKNTQLIHSYLCNHPAPEIPGMEYDDWYMVAAEGYMNAVHYWFSKDELGCKYRFSTIAFMTMQSAIRRFLHLSNAKHRKPPGEVVNLDVFFSDCTEKEAQDELSLHNCLADSTDIAAEFELTEDVEMLYQALSMLPERQQKVIRLRFFEDATLKTAGQAIGVTGARIQQIEVEALSRLKNILEGMEHMPRGEKTHDTLIKLVEGMALEGESVGKISIKTRLAQSTVSDIITRMHKKMGSALPKAKEPAPAATDTSSKQISREPIIPQKPENVKHYFSPTMLDAAQKAVIKQSDELRRLQEQIDALREKISALDDLYAYEAAELDRLRGDYDFMVGGSEHE